MRNLENVIVVEAHLQKLKSQFLFSAELMSKKKEIGINLAKMIITELDESPRQFPRLLLPSPVPF